MVERSCTHAAALPLSTSFLASRARWAGLQAVSDPATSDDEGDRGPAVQLHMIRYRRDGAWPMSEVFGLSPGGLDLDRGSR